MNLPISASTDPRVFSLSRSKAALSFNLKYIKTNLAPMVAPQSHDLRGRECVVCINLDTYAYKKKDLLHLSPNTSHSYM
jgi:hypothetical protein